MRCGEFPFRHRGDDFDELRELWCGYIFRSRGERLLELQLRDLSGKFSRDHMPCMCGRNLSAEHGGFRVCELRCWFVLRDSERVRLVIVHALSGRVLCSRRCE